MIRLLPAILPLPLLLPTTAPNDAGQFLLVRHDLAVQPIRLVEINDQEVVFLEEERWREVDLHECIALLRPEGEDHARRAGLLELADGQRYPGQAVSNGAPAHRVFIWSHALFGRLEIPLEELRGVRFRPGGPWPAVGDADVVLLTNGDRWEGFVTSLSDPVMIEIETEGGTQEVAIARERIVAVRMITPDRAAQGRRVWLADGTVADVTELHVADDGWARLRTRWAGRTEPQVRVPLTEIEAVLFDPGRLRPLAALSPARIEGPPTRYVLPAPQIAPGAAPLDLQTITFQGPITVRYALPAGATRLAAKATLPPSARRLGDFELLIRDEDTVVFRTTLNADQPVATINVPLRGSELSIELGEGLYGPIQDRLVLDRAMLLLEP